MDTARSPDPVREAKAYQDHLIGLLGDDDPASVQAGTAATLRALVASAGGDLRTRPEAHEWSALGCIAHLVDAEIVMASRYRFVLAHDEPAVMPYDQDLWVDRLHSDADDVDALLGLFTALREANLALWEGATADQRARIGIHAERGPESFDLSFRMISGHDRFHLAQAARALAAVRPR